MKKVKNFLIVIGIVGILGVGGFFGYQYRNADWGYANFLKVWDNSSKQQTIVVESPVDTNSELHERIAELETESDGLRGQIDTWKNTNCETAEQLTERDQHIEQLENRLTELLEKLESLENELFMVNALVFEKCNYIDGSASTSGTKYRVLIKSEYLGVVENIIVPETYNGMSVIGIAPNGFSDCARLMSIVLPDSISFVGSRAFRNCISLVSINLPNGIKKIDGSAFYNCTSLVSIVIPNTVTEIGSLAFADCESLIFVYIPNSVKTIGSTAFDMNSSSVLYTNLIERPVGWHSYNCTNIVWNSTYEDYLSAVAQ